MFWLYETPRVKRAPGARGGIGMFPTKAPTFAPGYLLSKTPSARKQFPSPISAWLFYGGKSVCVISIAAACMKHARKKKKGFERT